MVVGRYFHVKSIGDLLEYADYVKYVIFKIEEEDKERVSIKLLAGKFYWEGEVRKNTDTYDELMQVLGKKGIEIKGAMDLERLSERF